MKSDTERQISRLFERFERDEVGLGVALVAEGETIFRRYGGLANREHTVPVTADTVFPLASMSKPFTALVIMQLVEAGALHYGDALRRLLPDFPSCGEEIALDSIRFSRIPGPGGVAALAAGMAALGGPRRRRTSDVGVRPG